jgi:hypothetical protein
MHVSNPISPLPTHSYLVSGSLPTWEQLPQERQQELIQALAALLIHLPQLQTLLEVSDEPQS